MGKETIIKIETNPAYIVNQKVYFINLLRPKDGLNYGDFYTLKKHFPKLAGISEKLSYNELEYLIQKIEDKL